MHFHHQVSISSHLIITRHGTFRHAKRKDTSNCATKPSNLTTLYLFPKPSSQPGNPDRVTRRCRTCGSIDGKLEVNNDSPHANPTRAQLLCTLGVFPIQELSLRTNLQSENGIGGESVYHSWAAPILGESK